MKTLPMNYGKKKKRKHISVSVVVKQLGKIKLVFVMNVI
jgi:hypothetical protein